MQSKFQWELITGDSAAAYMLDQVTHRAKVPGGWLVRETWIAIGIPTNPAVSITFLPDPEHKWEVA